MAKEEQVRQAPPEGLGPAGLALWDQLTERLVYDAHELAIVAAACRQADDTASLEAALAEQGLFVEGSMGQMRLNPALSETRLGRSAIARLIAQLAIPAEGGAVPLTPGQRQAAKAAQSRWQRVERRREERERGASA